MLAYYFAPKDNKLRYGDDREIVIGKMHTVKCTPILCMQGLHGSIRAFDALKYAPGNMLYLVDITRNIIHGDDKICGQRRKYLSGFDATDLLYSFARKQAMINIKKIKPFCSNEGYKIINLWLESGDIAYKSAAMSAARSTTMSAARSAANSATSSAATSAAMSAAMSATSSAAWAAAMSAARSTTMSAARSAANSDTSSAAWDVAWSAAMSATMSAASSAAMSATSSAAWSAAMSTAMYAAMSAADSAANEMLENMINEELGYDVSVEEYK